MRISLYFVLYFVILATCWHVNNALPGRGGGRGGGGSRGSSSSRSSGGSRIGSFLSKSKSVSSSSGFKKSSKLKTLKKAAIIGAGAYVGYKLTKMTAKFAAWSLGLNNGWSFNDWNRWREADGFLCRRTEDCNWIDRRMFCQDYELNFTPSVSRAISFENYDIHFHCHFFQNLWFGGDVASIVGECSCPDGMFWDNDDLTCKPSFSIGMGAIIGIIIAGIIGCCCCCGLCLLARKMFS